MKRKQVLIILGITLIFVIIWVISSIYHNIVTSTISKNVVMQITPISPTFDIKTINSLKQREVVTPVYQFSGTAISPSPTPAPIIISSKSAVVASSGGNLR